ncbi:hypothetical protein B4135_3098 [Caldibacillus debilis]|uniref:Uncharacterized protein n=1 Tax=Caldibacillus debilis TaxID=301148 RepID=A0A150LIX9_9BACI|nr:hypothetical protein B4135_3098 [Caldibacillus debilis]
MFVCDIDFPGAGGKLFMSRGSEKMPCKAAEKSPVYRKEGPPDRERALGNLKF